MIATDKTTATDTNAQDQQHERPSTQQVRGHHKEMAITRVTLLVWSVSKLVVLGTSNRQC